MIPRFFVTGTDTDVGKTRVAAALALALRRTLSPVTPVTIVKPVQTGFFSGETGDAETALYQVRAHLRDDLRAKTHARELHRFRKPADPYSAALAEDAAPVTCSELTAEIEGIDGALVVEGAGGIAVPLNANETFADLAAASGLPVIVTVGLRLGCINHTLLTAEYLRSRGCRTTGAILVDRWQETPKEYRADVARCVSKEIAVLAVLPHDSAATAIAQCALQLEEVLCKRCPS